MLLVLFPFILDAQFWIWLVSRVIFCQMQVHPEFLVSFLGEDSVCDCQRAVDSFVGLPTSPIRWFCLYKWVMGLQCFWQGTVVPHWLSGAVRLSYFTLFEVFFFLVCIRAESINFD